MTNRIVTLTLNPAVDLASIAPAVLPTRKIRTKNERLDPGGGGINVSRVIHALGGETLALILVGGVTGGLIQDMLREAQVPFQPLPMAGLTRISLNIHEDSTGHEYRFVPEGPEVSEAEWQAVLATLETIEGDWLVASGSLPRGVPADIYARIGDLAARRGMRFVLDTSGPPLKAALGQWHRADGSRAVGGTGGGWWGGSWRRGWSRSGRRWPWSALAPRPASR